MPLPATAYVPGRPQARRPADTGHAMADLFDHGVALFDAGYYWEAHEAWERLWQAAPPDSAMRHRLQGLIALAAAGVKVRQGQAAGIVRHAQRAAGFFAQLPASPERDALIAFAQDSAATKPRPATSDAAEVVFPSVLPVR